MSTHCQMGAHSGGIESQNLGVVGLTLFRQEMEKVGGDGPLHANNLIGQ